MKLLERGRFLDQLTEHLNESRRGQGRLVLVAGEAGIGKTALVNAFCDDRAADVSVLRGTCDAVTPARPFAPIADMAGSTDVSLRAALETSDRNRVFDAFLAILQRRGAASTVVVLEDLHWADDATLDLLRVAGRRLGDLAVLLVGTYRDEEVGSEHPLRLALGDLPAGAACEMKLAPLTVAAVETLAAGRDIDARAVHRVTAGNPFFVTEVLAAGGTEVPATVRDAVFARIARLSRSAQRVVRAASVVGQRCDPNLLSQVANCEAAALEDCLARGILEFDRGAVQFRHELAQRAVLDSLASSERADLHGRTLAALRCMNAADPAQLAHHAVEAGDAAAVLEFAPVAAERAAGLGSHTEAAAHYAAALRFGGELDTKYRAELLEAEARECLVIDDVQRALAVQQEALECWRQLGDRRREGDCLCGLSLVAWFAGDSDGALELAELAVELLEPISPPGPELARAYATLAQRSLVAARDDLRAFQWGKRALELAEQLADEPVAVHALTTVGIAEICLGTEGGWARIEESVRRAKAARLEVDVARGLINLVEMARDVRQYALVDKYRAAAIGYVTDQKPDLDVYRRRLLSDLAEVEAERGNWQDASALAEEVIAERRSASVILVRALTVLGRLRARRGGQDAWPLLDEALAVAGPRADGLDLCALRAARAEAAWLEGNIALARDEAEIGLKLTIGKEKDTWISGDLGLWVWKAGGGDLPEGSAKPYVLHSTGRYRDAAAAWEAVGCPYHQGLALGDSEDEEDLRRALAIFIALGAVPMERRVVRRLRAKGVRRIARGPRASTRRNPAGLTNRELEVLALLAQGMRNANIAERLFVSPKTVDHHVSAILRKLGAANRSAAVEEATRLGLQDRDVVPAE